MLFGAALLAGGCASSGAVPRPFPTPGDDAPIAAPAPAPTTTEPVTGIPEPAPPTGSADGYTLRGTALSLRGAPYRNGGATPEGFDCSGFVQYVFARHGLTMPRETREQFHVGRAVRRDQLAPGDLVFFTTAAPGASHVGIVIDRDQFVHAPSTRGVVRVERLSASYWDRRFIGARRPY
jgi:cell wall-associated NlpC family hydrolase